MKSQSQLQQQAVAAALAKKSGAHGAAGNGRRLRRNVDVVVNAMKGRSQSSNLQQQISHANGAGTTAGAQGGGNKGHGVTAIQLSSQVQYPFVNGQLFQRKQPMMNTGGSNQHHSHSQQVLDNSQAIQQKISMYQNMTSNKKQQQLQQQQQQQQNQNQAYSQSSPGVVSKSKAPQGSGSNGSTKLVPAQLSRAFLQQRQNQTPNPINQQQHQQQQLFTPGGGNIQQQLQQMANKRISVPGDRNGQLLHNTSGGAGGNQLQAATAANMTNISSYYDISMIGGGHHKSAQNLEQVAVPRAASQKLIGQTGGKQTTHPFVQIKGAKSNRNNNYGSTLTNRQKSSKLSNQGNTLYSQISLKEIHSPAKPNKLNSKGGVNIQKMTGNNFYGKQQRGSATQQKTQQQMTQPLIGAYNSQSFVQYNQFHVDPATQSAQRNQEEGYVADIKDIQKLMDHMGVADDSSSSQQRSRNIASNVVTTNGATTNQNNHGVSQGAILNINTAQDINIYNNSFIVQSSPSHSSQQPNPATKAHTGVNAQGRQTTSKKYQAKGGNSINSNTHRVGNNGKQQNGRSSGSSIPAMGSSLTNMAAPKTVPGHHVGVIHPNQNRSMSTGRNQKTAHGQRINKLGAGQTKSSSSRVNAINEAYNSNRNYMINNVVQQQQQQMIPVVVQPNFNQGQNIITSGITPNQQQFNSQMLTHSNLSSNNKQFKGDLKESTFTASLSKNSNVYQQQPNSNKHGAKKIIGGGSGYNSTECINRSDESKLGGEIVEKRNSSLNRPQYNNLVSDSQKRLFFAQESGITMANKRNFKNVKKNREAFNTQQPASQDQIISAGMKQKDNKNSFQKQRQIVLDQVSSLINKGRHKIKSKEFNEAIKIFTEVLDNIDPNNVDAIFYRAISYLDQGNLQQAISELWRVVESKNLNESHEIELCQQAFVLLSIAHKRLGESQNAIQDLKQCIETYPSYPDAYLARGQTLLLQEQFLDALQDFEKYIKLNTKNSLSGYLGVGDCHKAKKNFAEATIAYSKAIKLLFQQKSKPNYQQLYQQCYMKRGLSGYHEGKSQQALNDLQCVIEKDTSNVKAHFYIGKLLAKGIENQNSKQTDAILHFEQVAKYPDQEFYCGNALFQIAKLRLRQKNYYEAFHCLKRAADNNFTSKRLAMYKDFTEGVLYLIKRKIKKGVQILSDLLEILVNKDRDVEVKEEDGKQQMAIDKKKRQANKLHTDYLIHQILHFRAYGYVAIEKYEVAQDDIRKIEKYGKIDAATIYNKWLGKGILRMDHEDYLMASKFFSKASKKYPSSKDPYCLQVISIVRSYTYSLGGYFIDQHIKYDKVLETKKFMDKAIANCCPKQKEPSLYFFRGLLNFQMHNFYEALADFNLAIDAEEESSAYFFLARGRTYACLSILTEAMKDLSVALNLDETLQQAYIYRGKCAYLIGDNNLAFLDFQRLILTDPKNPMVHVYAGNLLMTTGAYQDAIKAYENADTVEQTTISAFQRVRCFCALSDLDNAKILLEQTKKMQPDELILKFDGLCLDEIIKVSQSIASTNEQSQSDKVLKSAVSTFDELITTYESDRLLQLKRRDSILNVQIIPNVEKIKIEKAMVAQDVNAMKAQLPLDQQADLPSLSVDLDEPINMQLLKRCQPYSYYYENIFNVEDFYLYRGVFKFYAKRYEEAIEDFQQAHKAQKEFNKEHNGGNSGHQSGLNTRNQTLQHFTMGNNGTTREGRGSIDNTLQSNITDLSDIGLSSFNDVESLFNMFLCYFMLKDRTNAFNKLNELQRKISKRYTKQIPLIRIITLEHFGESEKASSELSRLKKADSKLYSEAFNNQQQQNGKKFLVQTFPCENRLCEKFPAIDLSFPTAKSNSVLAKAKLQIRLSFSMPFIKPPNMIPNVDEESIQCEFNLKQIDAPMPEAPWIKRCAHGINFTNHITKEGKDKEKFKKFFDENKNKTQQDATKVKEHGADITKNATQAIKNSELLQTSLSARARLLNNMVGGETLSDRHKISLMEDTSPTRIVNEEDSCQNDECLAQNQNFEVNLTVESQQDDRSSQMNLEQDSDDESYDSEEVLGKGTSAIRASGGLIKPERESMVNMGENVIRDNIREIRKMKKEIVEPNFAQDGTVQLGFLANGQEESKTNAPKAAEKRYAAAQIDESEDFNVNSGILPDQEIDSARQMGKLAESQQLYKATNAEPKKINERMLVGESQMRNKRERRVSNLSIGDLGNKTPKVNQKDPKEKGAQGIIVDGVDNVAEEQKVDQTAQRRSLFRTSIDNDSL